jgi:hypothetical protein
MRGNADGGRKENGQVLSYEIFIQVRLSWTSLPGVCVVFGAVFLWLAIWDSKKSGLPVWKTSALAILFHGLDYKALHSQTEETSYSRMQDRAKEMTVRMDDEWKSGIFGAQNAK